MMVLCKNHVIENLIETADYLFLRDIPVDQISFEGNYAALSHDRPVKP